MTQTVNGVMSALSQTQQNCEMAEEFKEDEEEVKNARNQLTLNVPKTKTGNPFTKLAPKKKTNNSLIDTGDSVEIKPIKGKRKWWSRKIKGAVNSY